MPSSDSSWGVSRRPTCGGRSCIGEGGRHIASVGRLVHTRYIPVGGGDFMERGTLFQSGRSQAVRLPKQFRFVGSEVFVKRVGKAVVLLPTDDAWDSLALSLDLFSDDYLNERLQPSQQQDREHPI